MTTFSLVAAVWLIIVQWVSSATGGYLSGRLRTKWVGIRTDEVFFRDTAHGFLAWALATVVVVGISSSAISSAVSTVGQAAGSAAGGVVSRASEAASRSQSMGYFVDSLFRADQPRADGSPEQATAEATRILARSVANGQLEAGDRTYLARLVAARTGMSQPDAEKRVDDTMAQIRAAEAKAKEAADAARKATATASFFTFFSMLIGAFIAAVAGAIGGRQRDDAETMA